MDDIKLIRRLRTIFLFQGMSDDELEEISKIVKKESYRTEKTIFTPGGKGGTLYLINKGSVRVTLPIMRFDDREVAVSVLKEGECFGELSFFDQKNHSATVTAVEDVELLEINHDDYESLINEEKELGLELQKKIIHKIVKIVRDMNKRYSLRPFIE